MAEAVVISWMIAPIPRWRVERSLRGVMRAIQQAGELVSDAQKAVAEQERHQEHQRRYPLRCLRF